MGTLKCDCGDRMYRDLMVSTLRAGVNEWPREKRIITCASKSE